MQQPGRMLMIRKRIPNVIMKKYRYLNTVSNKKKLLFFNYGNEYSNLEEVRLLYNEYISKFNIGIEKHNKPLLELKRKQIYKKKKELLKDTKNYGKEIVFPVINTANYSSKDLKRRKRREIHVRNKYIIEKNKDDASIILQRIFTKKFMIRIDETAYKNYIKYVVPKSFFQRKYDIKPFADMRNPNCTQERYDYDVAVAKHYENQKSHIYDAKKNTVITSMKE